MEDSLRELISEESLKGKVLLPFLSAVGVSLDQLEIEKTLRLRLGRGLHEYWGDEVTGRIDVLVKSRFGKNLFILELKREGSTLTDDDRDQGISYARLLDDMDPLVLLTNGQESRFYDTFTREEVTGYSPSEYSAYRAVATAESVRLRTEALKCFLGYSPENVKAFSVCQQAHRMAGVRSNGSKLDKKYVPALYVQRESVRKGVESFLATSASVFVIAGESGVGKTNEMCSLVEEKSSSDITLFFSAGAISSSLNDALVDDFNWHFSEHLRTPELVKRLADIASHAKVQVLIFVDGLEEAPADTFAQSISEFAMHLGGFAGRVRLILSVKSVEWNRFARFRGTPSALTTSLEHRSPDSDSEGDTQPFLLTELSDDELVEAEIKYRKLFDLGSLPEGRLRAHCHLPFFLRLVSEVYSGRQSIPSDITERELVQKWIDLKLGGMANAESCRLQLIAIAKAAYSIASASDSESGAALEQIPEEEILKHFGDSTRAVSNELVSHAVLIRHTDSFGRISYS